MNDFTYFFIIFQIIISIFNVAVIYFSNTKEIYIDTDNQISEYENNVDFSNFSSNIKIIEFYFPIKNSIKGFDEILNSKIDKVKNINNSKETNYKNSLSNININQIEHMSVDLKSIQNKINIAKSHGIYGIAIYYYWFNAKYLLEESLDIFLNNKNINIKFLL